MHSVWWDIGWAVIFSVAGGAAGIAMMALAAFLLPKIIDRFMPLVDEHKEIARGNQAVAEYFGRVVGAAIIGVSIVIAAAVLGGIFAALVPWPAT